MGSCDQQTRPLLLHSLNTFSSQIIKHRRCFAILLGVCGHVDEVLWSLVCLGSSKDRLRLVSHSWLKVLNMIHHSTRPPDLLRRCCFLYSVSWSCSQSPPGPPQLHDSRDPVAEANHSRQCLCFRQLHHGM